MRRLRCRSTAATLLLLLAVALAAPPAAAAPIAPASSWWSALVSSLDGLLGVFGVRTLPEAVAPEGPALEPDGFTGDPLPQEPAPLPGDADMTIGPIDGGDGYGGFVDPNGAS